MLAQAKEGHEEGPAAWLEQSVHSPVIGAGHGLALELPQTVAKIQVCTFFTGYALVD